MNYNKLKCCLWLGFLGWFLPPSVLEAQTADTFKICAGQTLTANTQAGLTNIQWKKDGVNLSGQTNAALTISTTGVYTYSATDGGSCTGNLCRSIVVLDSTCSTPSDTFRICAGRTLTATAQSGLTNIQWKKDGVNLSGQTNAALTISTTGVYTYSATDGNSCAGNLCRSIVVLDSTCSTPSDTFRICAGRTLTATAQSGLTNIQWKKDGVNLSGQTNAALTISTTGVYTYSATDGNSCTGSLCRSIVVLDSTCAVPCAITATFTQNSCNNNSTLGTTSDDYFTITVSAVSVTSGGASGKYEVLFNGTVLNTGGTAYGATVTVGTATTFKSDGTTTYQIKVRDMDITSCETTVFTTTPSVSCSIVNCPPRICIPVTVTRVN